MRPARPHCGQEGGNQGFPLLVNQPLSFRARCARKGKSLFPPAARLPQRVSRTGATPEMARRGRRALRGGVATAILVAFQQLGGGKFGVTHLARAARPYLRQQMPRIFGQMLTCLLLPKRKRGDSQEGRNFVSPLLCACGAQPRICRYDLAYTARRVVNRASLARRVVAPYGEVLQAASYSRARNARPYDKADI